MSSNERRQVAGSAVGIGTSGAVVERARRAAARAGVCLLLLSGRRSRPG